MIALLQAAVQFASACDTAAISYFLGGSAATSLLAVARHAA